MKQEDRAKAYEQFFVNSEAGGYFMAEINRLLDTNHEAAEGNPELARDYVQRAKGVREVSEHIQNVMTAVKKGAPIRS